MDVDRRELFKIIGVGMMTDAARGQQLPRALSDAQYRTLDRLCDILLPADAESPGAHDAGVAMYIDTVLHYADPRMRSDWRTGLDAVEQHARAHDKSFPDLDPNQQRDLVALLASRETQPATELERFFVLLKRTAIEVYCLSEAGRKSLGYRGDTAVARFAGCTHPEHGAAAE